jgi:hypothetical protein
LTPVVAPSRFGLLAASQLPSANLLRVASRIRRAPADPAFCASLDPPRIAFSQVALPRNFGYLFVERQLLRNSCGSSAPFEARYIRHDCTTSVATGRKSACAGSAVVVNPHNRLNEPGSPKAPNKLLALVSLSAQRRIVVGAARRRIRIGNEHTITAAANPRRGQSPCSVRGPRVHSLNPARSRFAF